MVHFIFFLYYERERERETDRERERERQTDRQTDRQREREREEERERQGESYSSLQYYTLLLYCHTLVLHIYCYITMIRLGFRLG